MLTPYISIVSQVYIPIAAGILAGLTVGFFLAQFSSYQGVIGRLHSLVPIKLGRFLFRIGMPISVVGFMRRADLSTSLYLAPAVAWFAILIGWGLSHLWIRRQQKRWSLPIQGSFTLASMLGNTGFFGFPVVLLVPQLGVDIFGVALFYDTLGTLLGAFGLGSVMAANIGRREAGEPAAPWWQSLVEIGRNPIILAFLLGLLLQAAALPLPGWLEVVLYRLSWTMVMLALVLMGLRLQQLNSWSMLRMASVVVAIKMLLIPLLVGIGLTLTGIDGPTRLVLVIMSGMPCAFATLVLAENYNLDRNLSVTCIGLSSACLLFTLPLWLWSFSGGCELASRL